MSRVLYREGSRRMADELPLVHPLQKANLSSSAKMEEGQSITWFGNTSMLFENFSKKKKALFQIQPLTLVFINLVPVILKPFQNSVLVFSKSLLLGNHFPTSKTVNIS